MTGAELQALWPLALGHDQEASACPWASLTRRTADYPSRRAQLAIAVSMGSVPPAPEVVAALYRCDDCALCQAWSILPAPPDLARALWPVRAWLVAQGAVVEAEGWREALLEHRHLYGDLSAGWDRLGPGDAGGDTLFIPGGAVLAAAPETAAAALAATRRVLGHVALDRQVADSGQVLRELGLAEEADNVQTAVRQRIAELAPRQVVVGTPKEAAALAELLQGLACQVSYAGTLLAQAALEGRLSWPAAPTAGPRVVLHASASLLRAPADHAQVEAWLAAWMGDRFCREPDAARRAWPAVVERPVVALEPELGRRLALGRLEQLLRFEPDVILTCDPFSQRALQAVAPPGVTVQDLLVFAASSVEQGGEQSWK